MDAKELPESLRPVRDRRFPRRRSDLIGENDAVARGQSIGHRQPQFMVRGKWMQKNYRRAFAQYVIDDFRVAALDFLESDALHASDLITETRGLSRCRASPTDS